ncbi:hypothetical protein VrSk94_18620 [Vibrio rotiferianus]
MYFRNLVTICLVSLTVACQSTPELTSDLKQELETPLVCSGESECSLMWERATYFVSHNAGYKIQIHNNTLIETYNSVDSSVKLAFKVSKEPLGDGKYRIWTKAWCANIISCHPNELETIAKAKRYIRVGRK